ncbi:hypothetical protein B5F77_11105 [Parabacteroides sp. An277]|uniref:DNA-binding protein n=1 Tax=Parabacteroides sp. An277 TaxID=1965619 RepID=UPI000B38BD7D|nr:DNA-binding protein [Parabacteroides sp. An277]OUO51135.1 hypothetical protein B5F77_11105 [Parabacteroides sp. An277]
MNETITFETMPKAMAYLITKVEALEKVLMEKSEAPAAPMDRWLNIDELKAYLPDHPAKATIYGWVSRREIPYHKGGKNYVSFNPTLINGYQTVNAEVEAS